MVHIPLLHILNLDTIGGVESLYMNFFSKNSLSHNCTIISGKRVHPDYLRQFHLLGIKKPFHEQYLFGLRIPKFLRWIGDLRRGMIEDLFKKNCRWVFWNRIEEKTPPHESIYYEHGASWMSEKSTKKERFLHSMRKIIANSHAAKIFLSEFWGIPRESIHVIPNPIRSDIQILQSPKKMHIGDSIRLGYIGRLVALKSPGTALHVLHHLIQEGIDATLDIAGVGPEEKFLQSLAKNLGISEKVRFLGVISDIHLFYNNIDLLLIPSVREPLGLVALEAAARGVPVIASMVDGLSESVENGVSGVLLPPTLDSTSFEKEFISQRYGFPLQVVDPVHEILTDPKFLDPTKIGSTIKKYLEDKDLYSKHCIGSIEHAKKRISFDEYAQQLLEEFTNFDLNDIDDGDDD